MTDAAYIKGVRERSGLSREEFGERVGVTVTTVYRWESGVRKILRPMRMLIEREFPPIKSRRTEKVK